MTGMVEFLKGPGKRIQGFRTNFSHQVELDILLRWRCWEEKGLQWFWHKVCWKLARWIQVPWGNISRVVRCKMLNIYQYIVIFLKMFICDGEKEYESNVRMTPSTGICSCSSSIVRISNYPQNEQKIKSGTIFRNHKSIAVAKHSLLQFPSSSPVFALKSLPNISVKTLTENTPPVVKTPHSVLYPFVPNLSATMEGKYQIERQKNNRRSLNIPKYSWMIWRLLKKDLQCCWSHGIFYLMQEIPKAMLWQYSIVFELWISWPKNLI